MSNFLPDVKVQGDKRPLQLFKPSTCMYCGNPFDDSAAADQGPSLDGRSRAHVIPKALLAAVTHDGGAWVRITRDEICRGCNQAIGQIEDDALHSTFLSVPLTFAFRPGTESPLRAGPFSVELDGKLYHCRMSESGDVTIFESEQAERTLSLGEFKKWGANGFNLPLSRENCIRAALFAAKVDIEERCWENNLIARDPVFEPVRRLVRFQEGRESDRWVFYAGSHPEGYTKPVRANVVDVDKHTFMTRMRTSAPDPLDTAVTRLGQVVFGFRMMPWLRSQLPKPLILNLDGTNCTLDPLVLRGNEFHRQKRPPRGGRLPILSPDNLAQRSVTLE